jgi:hypothetical protein
LLVVIQGCSSYIRKPKWQDQGAPYLCQCYIWGHSLEGDVTYTSTWYMILFTYESMSSTLGSDWSITEGFLSVPSNCKKILQFNLRNFRAKEFEKCFVVEAIYLHFICYPEFVSLCNAHIFFSGQCWIGIYLYAAGRTWWSCY